MIEFPLTPSNRLHLARVFKQVSRVDLSIDCVIEGQMGKAYVDDMEQPMVYQLQTGPFVYLAGVSTGDSAQKLSRNLPSFFILMPSAPGWADAAQTYYGDHLKAFDRYQLSAEQLNVQHIQACLSNIPIKHPIDQMDRSFVKNIWGQEHFVDLSGYDSAEDFLERGIGYISVQNGKIAGAAYASLVCSRGIEVSIYVEEDYRRQGLATALASYLLVWCLERNLEPHWDAANPESCHLASKLGYKFVGTYEAYYLWNN